MGLENTYEGMFLLDAAKFASNPEGTTQDVLKILEKSGATVLASRPWQEGKLAYPIDGHKKGLYFLAYFRMDGTLLPEVTRACKLNESIIRQMILKLDPALVEPLLAMVSGEGSFRNIAGEEAEAGVGGREGAR